MRATMAIWNEVAAALSIFFGWTRRRLHLLLIAVTTATFAGKVTAQDCTNLTWHFTSTAEISYRLADANGYAIGYPWVLVDPVCRAPKFTVNLSSQAPMYTSTVHNINWCAGVSYGLDILQGDVKARPIPGYSHVSGCSQVVDSVNLHATLASEPGSYGAANNSYYCVYCYGGGCPVTPNMLLDYKRQDWLTSATAYDAAVPTHVCRKGPDTISPDKPKPQNSCPANYPTAGNPVRLSNQRKVESIACIQHEAPGMDINLGMTFGPPRVSVLAPGQSGYLIAAKNTSAAVVQVNAPSVWSHGYSRRLLSYSSDGAYKRIAWENGESFDFGQYPNPGGATLPPVFRSMHGQGYGSLSLDTVTGQYTYTYPNGDTDIYNAAGQLLQVRERGGSYLSLARTGSTQLDITSWPSNRTVRITYADQGAGDFQPVSVVDLNPPSGTPVRSATMAYVNGMLSKHTDVSGRVHQYQYDSLGRMTRHYNPLNNPDVLGAAAKFTQVFYSCATCTTVAYEIMPNGTRLDFTPVTGQDWTLEVKETGTDGAVQIDRYQFDQRQLLTKSYVTNSTSKFAATLYDYSGNATDVYDTELRRTEYSYDYNSFVTRVRAYKDATNFDETLIERNEWGQPTRLVEPSGTVQTRVYDPAKSVLTSIAYTGSVDGAPLTQTTTLAYNPVTINGQAVQIGLPTAATLPDGSVITQSYSALGYPSVTTFDVGAGRLNITETASYDGRGFLTAFVDRRGIRTQYEYSQNPANGQFGQLGIASAEVYDTIGVNGLAARNIRREYYRDAMLNVTRVVNDAGVGRANATTLASYAMLGSEGDYLLTQMTDPISRIIRQEYDSFGRAAKFVQVGARSGASTALTTCTDASEARSNATDRITRYCYTPEGWPLKTILDDGRVAIQVDYQGFGDGLPRALTDARGVRTAVEYDGKGRPFKLRTGTAAVVENSITYPALNGEFTVAYDGNDRLLSVIAKLATGNRNLVQNSYDGLGRLSQSTDGAGNQTRYSYDAERNFLLSTVAGANTAAQAVTVQNSFDPLGRLLTSRTDPLGKNLLTRYGYATTGDRWLLKTVTNPNNNITNLAYNSLGSLSSQLDALGSNWNFSTNNLGDLTAVDVPGAGASTNYNVNAVGQTLSVARNGQTESWLYNLDGSVNRYTDFSGQNVLNQYDATGRLLSIDYAGTPSDPSGLRSDVDAIQYWANDLVRSVTSRPNGSSQESTAYAYDASNRLKSSTRNSRAVGYAYNLDETLAQINYWGRSVVGYGYGAATANNGQLRFIAPFGQPASAYGYRASGLLGNITRPAPNGVSTSYAHDAAARLLSMTHNKAGVTQYGAAYEIDNNGNRTQLTETFAAVAASPAQSAVNAFRYDDLDRLIRAEYGAIGSTPKREENYLYDAVGNRTSVQQTDLHNTSDFNRDGTPDLLWRNYNNTSGENTAWIMGGVNGDQRLRQSSAAPLPQTDWKNLSGDINGDGVNELLWRNLSAGNNSYWKMGGPDNLVGAASGPLLWVDGTAAVFPDAEWLQEGVADMNQDGKGDILWRNYSTGENLVWLMGAGANGQQLIGSATIITLGVAWQLATVADFNQDGFTDLLWHNQTSGSLVIWYLGLDVATGAGTRLTGSAGLSYGGVAAVVAPASNKRIRGSGDANQDGIPDIYWQNTVTGDVELWTMTRASGTVANKSVLAITPRLPAPWLLAKSSSYTRMTAQWQLSYDASDRITNVGYSYDANGNLTATPAIGVSAATTYAYTAANRLLRTVKGGITAEYQYDGSGNLIRQIRAGVSTDYVLDENRALANMIGEINGTSESLYAYGAEGLHAQQTWLDGVAQAVEYPLLDGLGSLKAVSDVSGALVKAMSFDAWGQLRYSVGTGSNAFGFTGEQSLADGTTYLRARSYLPSVGRFLQRDTFAGFDYRPQSLNRHAYVEGNPGLYRDPSGHLPLIPIPIPIPMPDWIFPTPKPKPLGCFLEKMLYPAAKPFFSKPDDPLDVIQDPYLRDAAKATRAMQEINLCQGGIEIEILGGSRATSRSGKASGGIKLGTENGGDVSVEGSDSNQSDNRGSTFKCLPAPPKPKPEPEKPNCEDGNCNK